MVAQNGCPKWLPKMIAQNGCQKWLAKMVAQNGCPKWNQFRFSQYHEDLKRSLIQQAVISITN